MTTDDIRQSQMLYNKQAMEITNEVLHKIALSAEEASGRKIVFLFVQGSQNYNLETPDSDIDCKAFCLPSFEDFYYSKEYSSTLEGEYGQTTVHDIRMLVDLLIKMNPTYIEMFFSKYLYFPHPELKKSLLSFVPEFRGLRSFYNNLFRLYKYRFLQSMIGTFAKKLKELEKPTAIRVPVIEQYGYDIKSASHAIRYFRLLTLIVTFIRRQSSQTPYEAFAQEVALKDLTARQFLLDIKLGKMPKDDILDRLDFENQYVQAIKSQYEMMSKKPVDGTLANRLRKEIYEFVKNQLA